MHRLVQLLAVAVRGPKRSKADLQKRLCWFILVAIIAALHIFHSLATLTTDDGLMVLASRAHEIIRDGPQRHVSVVIPYVDDDIEQIRKALARWGDVGRACSSTYTGRVDLVFYNNLARPTQGADRLERHIRENHDQPGFTCFSEMRTIYASLQADEDSYPAGPSFMFFRLFLDKQYRDRELKDSTHVFWMEWDTRPVRALWIDAIVKAAESGDFWVRGSHYFGPGLDSSVVYKEHAVWVGHINGNALYNLRDSHFHDFMRLTIEREPPGDYWRPFDIALWKVLMDMPYSWRWYQRYRPMFQYASFMAHVGFSSSGDEVLKSLPDCYLVHGNQGSAGNRKYHAKFKNGKPTQAVNVYGDELRPDVRLSVFMVVGEEDFDLAAIALDSVRVHLPNALELVAMVPEPAVDVAKKQLPGHVRVEGHPSSASGAASIYAADIYTQGEYILHLRPDVVLYRTVLFKDLFLYGKPLTDYDSDVRAPAHRLCQQEVEALTGVHADFSFSQRPEHIYPRSLYKLARDHLRQGLAASSTQILDIPSEHCTFSFLEAFAHAVHPELLSFNYVGEKWLSGDNASSTCTVLRPAFACQGQLALRDPSTRQQLRKHMQDVAQGRVGHCFALKSFLEATKATRSES